MSIFTPREEVVKGWNNKIQSSSLVLSRLVPFINLVSLYDRQDLDRMSKRQRENIRTRQVNFAILNDSSNVFGTSKGEDVVGVPLARSESQLQSVNYKGGAGLNSLEVERGTKESLTVRYNLSMKIMDSDTFDVHAEYTSLIELNSLYLLVYGWSGGDGILFKDPPPIFELGSKRRVAVDVESDNEGFWKAELVRLYKFDFSFDENGHIDATLGFMSPHNAAMTFIKSATVNQSLKELLNSPDSGKDFLSSHAKSIIKGDSSLNKPTIDIVLEKESTQAEINSNKDQSNSVDVGMEDGEEFIIVTDSQGDQVKIPNKPIEDSGTSTSDAAQAAQQKVSNNQRVPGFYYLGYVLEALRFTVNNNNKKENINIDFFYEDIEQNNTVRAIFNKFYDPSNTTTVGASKNINNVFKIPLVKERVDGILTSSTSPITELFRDLIDSSVHALPGIDLASRTSDGVIHVFLASANLDGLEEEIKQKSLLELRDKDKTLFIDYGAKNSLCQTVDLTSKLDPNAFEVYRLPVPITGTEKDLLDFNNPKSIGGKLKKVGLDQAILDIIEQEKTNNPLVRIDAQSVVSKLIVQDARNYRAIVSVLLEEQDVFGRLLGFYLKRTTLTIHGTVGVNAYNLVVVRGILKQLQGLYHIVQVTDQVTPDNFVTILEATLREPFTKQII